MNNRSVPTATLLPHLVYSNLPDACDWLVRVFGFTEHHRYGHPVSGIQMYLGGAYIMLTKQGCVPRQCGFPVRRLPTVATSRIDQKRMESYRE